MAIRVYIVPMVILNGIRQPKYIPALTYVWGALDYGAEDTALCSVVDISVADHDALVLNTDAFGMPADLTGLMSSTAVTKAQTYLEGLNIPAGWINTTRTYLDVVRIVGGLFMFNQRWRGRTGSSPFKQTLTLSTIYSDLTTERQDDLKYVFDSLGVDRTLLTASSTLRDGFVIFGKQFRLKPLVMNGISI